MGLKIGCGLERKHSLGRRWALGGDGVEDMIWVGEKMCP
jgi:hypothetical protein